MCIITHTFNTLDKIKYSICDYYFIARFYVISKKAITKSNSSKVYLVFSLIYSSKILLKGILIDKAKEC